MKTDWNGSRAVLLAALALALTTAVGAQSTGSGIDAGHHACGTAGSWNHAGGR